MHLGGTFTGKKGTFTVDDEISSVSHDSWRILSGSGDYAGLRGAGLCRGKIVVQEVSFRGSCTGSVTTTARDAARDSAAFARAHAALGPLVPPKGRKLRVGIVSDAAVVATNRVVDGLPLLGFERAVKTFGVDARVVYVAPGDDSTEALRSLARQRYDLIIAPLFDVAPVDIVAPEFPKVRFYLPGAPDTGAIP